MKPDPHHCRSHLTSGDWSFVASALTGDESNERALRSLMSDSETLDQVLDQAQLLKAVLEMREIVAISPELYFYILMRHAMTDAGIEDRSLADYVAAVMADAARGNRFARRGEQTLEFTYHVDFLKALDGASPQDRFHLQVHCGNQFLILTGLFPQFLNARAARRGAPDLAYYEGVARNAFRDAGAHPLADEFGVGEVYRQLSGAFGQTRRILNRMAAEYLFLGA